APARISACQSLLVAARPPTDIYPLSLHDALPISQQQEVIGCAETRLFDQAQHATAARTLQLRLQCEHVAHAQRETLRDGHVALRDRKSTRLNSSHVKISYAVFCLKKKITNTRSR